MSLSDSANYAHTDLKAVGTDLWLGGQKKICAAKPRKIFLNYTFVSKGYDFVH